MSRCNLHLIIHTTVYMHNVLPSMSDAFCKRSYQSRVLVIYLVLYIMVVPYPYADSIYVVADAYFLRVQKLCKFTQHKSY